MDVQETRVQTDRVLTIPNLLTFARLLGVPLFLWLVLVAKADVAAFLVLAASGATDWLDGYVARRTGQISRLGQLLDPAAARLFILVTIVALAWRGGVPWWLVVALVARDVVLALMLLVLARAGEPPLPVHLAGKAGTFALLYAFPLLLLATWSGPVGTAATVLGWAFALWGVGLYWFSGVLYLLQARRVLRVRTRVA